MGTFLIIGIAGFLVLVTREYRIVWRNAALVRAFYLAEGAAQHGIHTVEESDITATYSYEYSIDGHPVDITIQPAGTGKVYTITGSATVTSHVGSVSQSVTITIQKNPPARVFDYVYFINNWGWFFGRGITAKGDVRSNGIFSFRRGPKVDGHIYAGNEIDVDGYGIRGKGGRADHQHEYSDRLYMPNLMNLLYYENLAIEKGGYIKRGNQILVNAVHGDDPTEKENVVLTGTPSSPIEIHGPVVIRGDVVIKGTITGQGTIYAGRNIYLAGNIKYKNAPSSPRPASDNPGVVDQWVQANADKDIVGFAATENIILGDYTRWDWYAHYWLFDMGDEDVGHDGIPNTGDEGEDDGIFEPSYEDLDEDGVYDDNYNWNDVQLQDNIRNYDYVPYNVRKYRDIATNYLRRLNGIFYTNHAYTGRVGYGVQINGAIVSKDEAIIYRNTITMNYDERIHSRYRRDSNWLIDLNLPIANKVEVLLWESE